MNSLADQVFWWIGAGVCIAGGFGLVAATTWAVVEYTYRKWGGFEKFLKVMEYAREHGHEIYKDAP